MPTDIINTNGIAEEPAELPLTEREATDRSEAAEYATTLTCKLDFKGEHDTECLQRVWKAMFHMVYSHLRGQH